MSTNNRIPTRTLPLLYFGTGHVSLALACLFAACWPQAVAGFFYHAWLVGLVHLVTLGWISFSILGAMFIVAPIALRLEMPPRRGDYVAYTCAVIGLIGMVGHLWIQRYSGMAWSAALVASAVIYGSVRIASRVRQANIPPAVKLHIVLACVNLWLAGSMGVLLAIDKSMHFLPGFVLTNVFAHAHLAALGWATLMVVGVAYRMLPMTIPSKMPTGRSVWISAALLEVGVIGLFVSLLLRNRWAVIFGAAIVSGLVAFAAHVVWMLRRRVSKPVNAPRVDFGLMHAGSAAVWLLASIAIGMALLTRSPSPQMLHAAGAYGVFGLIGFLAQMVIAMQAKLLPTATWLWTYTGSQYRVVPPPPQAMRDRSLQAIVFVAWTIGVPALAGGMFFESAVLVALGAWSLFVGVAVAAVDNAFVAKEAIAKPSTAVTAFHHDFATTN